MQGVPAGHAAKPKQASDPQGAGDAESLNLQVKDRTSGGCETGRPGRLDQFPSKGALNGNLWQEVTSRSFSRVQRTVSPSLEEYVTHSLLTQLMCKPLLIQEHESIQPGRTPFQKPHTHPLNC